MVQFEKDRKDPAIAGKVRAACDMETKPGSGVCRLFSSTAGAYARLLIHWLNLHAYSLKNSCIYTPTGWGNACRFVVMRIPKEKVN